MFQLKGSGGRVGTGFVLLAGLVLGAGCYATEESMPRSGQIQIKGLFLEAPCGLVMRSEFQELALPGSAIATLQKQGDTGEPKQLIFHLVGCKTAENNSKLANRDAKVRFMSVADPDEPTLFRMGGVTGIGLRLLDSQGRMVIPGESRKPLFTSAAMDVLTYTVIPVRTKAPLSTGNFEATVHLGMSYE